MSRSCDALRKRKGNDDMLDKRYEFAMSLFRISLTAFLFALRRASRDVRYHDLLCADAFLLRVEAELHGAKLLAHDLRFWSRHNLFRLESRGQEFLPDEWTNIIREDVRRRD